MLFIKVHTIIGTLKIITISYGLMVFELDLKSSLKNWLNILGHIYTKV